MSDKEYIPEVVPVPSPCMSFFSSSLIPEATVNLGPSRVGGTLPGPPFFFGSRMILWLRLLLGSSKRYSREEGLGRPQILNPTVDTKNPA